VSWEIESILTAARFVGLVVLIAAFVAIVVTLIYGVLRGAERARVPRSYWAVVRGAAPFIFLVALVGGLCGHLGGSSRDSVVGSLLPALFSLFGGYIAYYLGAKKDQSGKIAVNTLAFLLSFFFLYSVSATWRQSNEAADFCRGVYSNPDYVEPDQRADRDRVWAVYCNSAMGRFTKPKVDGPAAGSAAG
jgi:hypothetical protein